MKRLALLLALCLASPALAGDPERAAQFIGAIRDNGCAMTEDEAASVFPGLGFEPDETREFVEVLYEATLVGFNEDWSALQLSQELCEADSAEDAATYAEAFAAYEAATPDSIELTDEDLIAILREDLGIEFIRSAAAFVASNEGCALDVSDADAAEAGLLDFVVDYMSQVYGLAGPVSMPVEDEMRALVVAFLADPGDEFEAGDGRLELVNCTPTAD